MQINLSQNVSKMQVFKRGQTQFKKCLQINGGVNINK